jgi:hypothetical protein
MSFNEIYGVGEETKQRLTNSGIDTVETAARYNVSELQEHADLGSGTAQQVVDGARKQTSTDSLTGLKPDEGQRFFVQPTERVSATASIGEFARQVGLTSSETCELQKAGFELVGDLVGLREENIVEEFAPSVANTVLKASLQARRYATADAWFPDCFRGDQHVVLVDMSDERLEELQAWGEAQVHSALDKAVRQYAERYQEPDVITFRESRDTSDTVHSWAEQYQTENTIDDITMAPVDGALERVPYSISDPDADTNWDLNWSDMLGARDDILKMAIDGVAVDDLNQTTGDLWNWTQEDCKWLNTWFIFHDRDDD